MESPVDRSTRTLPFFAVTLGFTFLVQVPALLARLGLLEGPPERFMGIVGLGLFGPLVGALIVGRFERGGPGVGAIFRRLQLGPVTPAWFLIATLFNGVLFAVGAGFARLVGVEGTDYVYPPVGAQRITALILVPWVEEIGWRGFALPRLNARFGSLRGSVLLGLIWGLWHVPMLILSGTPSWLLPILAAFFVAGSMTFTWVFIHTKGSLLTAVLMHFGAHLSNPHQVIATNPTPAVVQSLAYIVAAILVVLLDRASWRRTEPL
ncbi:MAG: CPBP family intramembrane metalloprotease [Deltaproteobacteria bacterium]|nr:CPBP family intramembrane metalloprotease [Deltaproteobacteria bacterium]